MSRARKIVVAPKEVEKPEEVEVVKDTVEVENPLDKLVEDVNKVAEEHKEEVSVVKEVSVKEPKTRVVLNRNLDTYIGTTWYRFEKGKTYNVPKNVKEILLKAGFLAVI